MKLKITFLTLMSLTVLSGQDNNLKIFDGLVGKNWIAESEWGNGTEFRQEITFEYSLEKTIVIAKSKGFTDANQIKYGLRNHGIRQFDTTTKKIRFWEFDVFGGLTTGEIKVVEDNLFHIYDYGGTTVTDAWIKLDTNTYQFIVGVRKDGKWIQKYLETEFVAKQ